MNRVTVTEHQGRKQRWETSTTTRVPSLCESKVDQREKTRKRRGVPVPVGTPVTTDLRSQTRKGHPRSTTRTVVPCRGTSAEATITQRMTLYPTPGVSGYGDSKNDLYQGLVDSLRPLPTLIWLKNTTRTPRVFKPNPTRSRSNVMTGVESRRPLDPEVSHSLLSSKGCSLWNKDSSETTPTTTFSRGGLTLEG